MTINKESMLVVLEGRCAFTFSHCAALTVVQELSIIKYRNQARVLQLTTEAFKASYKENYNVLKHSDQIKAAVDYAISLRKSSSKSEVHHELVQLSLETGFAIALKEAFIDDGHTWSFAAGMARNKVLALMAQLQADFNKDKWTEYFDSLAAEYVSDCVEYDARDKE